MEFMELERLMDLIRKSRAEAIIKLKSPENTLSSLTSRPFFFSKLQAMFLLPDWMTPVINQHWFQIALLGVSATFYLPLVVASYWLAWLRKLSSSCRTSSCRWSAYPAGSAVGSRTGLPQINCFMLTHFKGKICFQDAVRGCSICHPVTTPTLGMRIWNSSPPSARNALFMFWG